MTALTGLHDRLRFARLHFLTDLRHSEDEFRHLLNEVYAGGVDMVQIRDARADGTRLAKAATIATQIAQQHRKLAIVGQRLDVAAKVNADAVHLGAADQSSQDARAQLHPHALVGKSIHSRNELRAELGGERADYLFISPVFLGDFDMLGLIDHVAQLLPVDAETVPWFAVGGINMANIDEVLDAGARRIGVSGAILHSPNPGQMAADLRAAVDARWPEPVTE